MTNLERYNKIMKINLNATDEDLNDDVMVYMRWVRWDSVGHMGIVSDLEEAFGIMFETLDITSFSTYSKGIEILQKLGVDMKG